MTKKNALDAYVGQDKIVGRPIRLNKVELSLQRGKNYAELLFFGDVHIGYPQCRIELAQQTVQWALKNKVPALIMGDMVEAGLTTSIGDSVYHQKLNPQEQMETAIEMLEPLAKAGLIIGIHQGNHENRILKTTGVDITKVMARILGVPFLGYACWSLLKVGSQKYSLYSQHGVSGAKFKHTKLKALVDQTGWISADIMAMGHVHALTHEVVTKQYVDKGKGLVREEDCHVVLTGSYIGWDKSYAQAHGLPITSIGSPRAKLSADKKDVWFSV